MSRLAHAPEAAHHSPEWHSSTPLPSHGNIVQAIVGKDVAHAQLYLAPERILNIYRGDEFARHVTEHANIATVMAHTALLETARDTPFFLFEDTLPRDSDDNDEVTPLRYVPLARRTSVVLETAPDAAFKSLRHRESMQLAEIGVDGYDELHIEAFGIDDNISLHSIKCLGEAGIRSCRLMDRNYTVRKRVDTREGVTVL